MYHGVRTGQLRINGRHITAKHFEKQLQYFKRKFSVVPLDQLCEMKFAGVVPEKHAIALTFDDGFVNNLTVALPLLEKYGLPATFLKPRYLLFYPGLFPLPALQTNIASFHISALKPCRTG